MNTYNSSLTNTYSDLHPTPLSRSEHTAPGKDTRPVAETIQEGQQFRGEIINRTTTGVTVRLPGGQTLQARLDVSIPLSIGQTASFEVTHADPALISLRILQDESAFAQNALIQKALTAAELPLTSRNAEFVTTLLQHNLPISKDSILSLIRQSNTYPNTDINTLALMAQHKIPVTQATLIQFEAYQNYEHQILPQLENLAHSFGELVSSSEPSLSGLFQTLQRLLQTPSELSSNAQPLAQTLTTTDTNPLVQLHPEPLPATGTTTPPSEPLPTPAATATLSASDTDSTTFFRLPQSATVTPPTATVTDSPSLAQQTLPVTHTVVQTSLMTDANPLTQLHSESLPEVSDSAPPLEQITSGTDPLPTPTGSEYTATLGQTTSGTESLPTPTGSNRTTTLRQTPSDTETLPPVPSHNEVSPEDSFLMKEVTFPVGESILTQETLEHRLFTRWTLSPKDISSPEKIKDFYQRLREDLSELHTTLRSLREKSASESPLERLLSDTVSATQQLQENLEFMNMLNRIFPYVQLPIRFSDKTTHGELYVYTKKEKLRSKDGSLSVLLHLDMESLGPTDVFLSLTENQLTSRFYLNDSSLEALFTQHLPELKETLTEKGFSVNFELIARQQGADPVREFLSTHDNSGLSRFTFDCRA